MTFSFEPLKKANSDSINIKCRQLYVNAFFSFRAWYARNQKCTERPCFKGGTVICVFQKKFRFLILGITNYLF